MIPRLVYAAAVPAVVIACSDSGPAVISLNQLVGTWGMSRLVYIRVSDGAVSPDQLKLYGVHITISIDRSGTAVLTVDDGITTPTRDSAQVSTHGDTLVFQATSSLVAFKSTVRMSGSTMTWLAVDTSSFDVDGDGTDDIARERDTWQRR